MTFKESETLELKKSTAELDTAIVSIVSMLNKQGHGDLYGLITLDPKGGAVPTGVAYALTFGPAAGICLSMLVKYLKNKDILL